MRVIVMVLALLLAAPVVSVDGGAVIVGYAQAEAGRRGGGRSKASRGRTGRARTERVRQHTRKLPGGKRVPVRGHGRAP